MESTSYEIEIQETTKSHGQDSETNLVRRQRREEQGKPPTNTSHDESVIARFGKKQRLKRRFKSLSSIGLICGVMLTWIGVLFSLQFGLENGGTAGLIYGYIAAWAGGMTQALVMAEMASMIPLAGGPFNWAALLAPPWCRKYLSYTAGWMIVVAYQAFVSAVCYTCASLIQGLIILNHPNYDPKLWSAAQVFGEFQNTGGWQSQTLSCFVGWWVSYSSFFGSDCSDHIAEEIYDAARVIPFSIWASFVFNGTLGLAMLITVLFCIQDVQAATESATGFPIMDIFVTALESRKAGSAMIIAMVVVDVLSTSSCVATASRVLWAFSRENGLPASKFLVKVDPESRLPFNAIIITLIINCLIALISIGSITAYNAFYSVVITAYYTSFLVAAIVMLNKRLTTPESDLPWGPFRLRRFGVPITIISILYTLVALFFSFWPSSRGIDPSAMNWSIVIYGAAVLFSSLFWMISGRYSYKGPIWEFEE